MGSLTARTACLAIIAGAVCALAPLTAAATSLAFSDRGQVFFQDQEFLQFGVLLSHLDEEEGSYRITMVGRFHTDLNADFGGEVPIIEYEYPSVFSAALAKDGVGLLGSDQITLLHAARPLLDTSDGNPMSVRGSTPFRFLKPKRFVASWEVTPETLVGDYTLFPGGGPIFCRLTPGFPIEQCYGEGASGDPFSFSIFDTEAAARDLTGGGGAAVIPVPEPSTAPLLGAALLALSLGRRRL